MPNATAFLKNLLIAVAISIVITATVSGIGSSLNAKFDHISQQIR